MLSEAKHLLLFENVGDEQILRFAQNDKRRAQDDSVKRFFNKLLGNHERRVIESRLTPRATASEPNE